jgi:hypothetical protein
MNVKTAPKKNFGTYARIETGSMNDRSPNVMRVSPVARLLPPDLMVKIVCEKMYEPVNPPERPERRLQSPTCTAVWVGGRGVGQW